MDKVVQYNVTTRLVASGLIDRLPESRVYLTAVIARLGEECLHVPPSHQIVDWPLLAWNSNLQMSVKKWFGPNSICLSSKRRNKDTGQELYVLRVQYWHMKKPHFQQVIKAIIPTTGKKQSLMDNKKIRLIRARFSSVFATWIRKVRRVLS